MKDKESEPLFAQIGRKLQFMNKAAIIVLAAASLAVLLFKK